MVIRRGHQAVIVLWAAAMLACAAMIIGPALNDRAIATDPGRGLATVISVSATRTHVEYLGEDDIWYAPQRGVLYPTGLGQGQRVWVRYSRANPELVAVEGRYWTLAIIPAASVAAVASMIAALLWWVISKVGRRWRS